MSLVTYCVNSSSESEDETNTKPATISTTLKRPLLPTANTLLGTKQTKLDQDNVHDDPAQHGGRIRSFEHERGNWATHVYVSATACIDQLEEFQAEAIAQLAPLINLQPIKSMHLSLSKTVVLQYHQIDEFTRSLQQALSSCVGFSASLKDLKVYTNEEKTRTFLAVQLDAAYTEKISALLRPIDVIMCDYRLPQFYTKPSFHVSLLWCLGDQQALLMGKLNELQQLLDELDIIQLCINAVHCKCGNKSFIYRLK